MPVVIPSTATPLETHLYKQLIGSLKAIQNDSTMKATTDCDVSLMQSDVFTSE